MKITRFEMVGAKELDAQLAALGTTIATKLMLAAIRGSAEELQQHFIEAAPYRPGERKKYWTLKSGETRSASYGHLRDNIRIRKVRPQKENAVVFGVTTGDAFWGRMLEFGTIDMPAHPWARPLVDAAAPELVKIQVDILRAGIEEAASKGRRSYGSVMSNGRNG